MLRACVRVCVCVCVCVGEGGGGIIWCSHTRWRVSRRHKINTDDR